MDLSMGFYVKLFLIVTYISYICLIAFTFITINCRIKHILSKNNLTCVLDHSYNIFTVIEGLKSFLALFLLTLVPLLHLTGYFLAFVTLTEYTEGRLLTIIINREVHSFKNQVEKIKVTHLYKLFLKNNYYKGIDSKVTSICNYFNHDFAKNNLFIFYKFLSLKNSFNEFYEIITVNHSTTEESILLAHYKEPILQLEKDINLTYSLIKKYELHFG